MADDQTTAALRRLAELSSALLALGLSTKLVPDRQPFPGLAVMVPTGAYPRPAPRYVTIMAGTAHYWRRKAGGDLELIGPIDEPARVAKTIRDRLNGTLRR